jgi:predicted nuclease of predicted toxin-antitoxin system
MARFYTNENVPVQVVAELRRMGHDVVTSLDAGNANSAVPDAEVLAFAVADGRILLTHNRRHFLRLHQHRTADHAGIVLCSFDADFCRQAQRIDAAVATNSEMTNKLVRVNRPGWCRRVLRATRGQGFEAISGVLWTTRRLGARSTRI